ncbi:MAG: phosphonoacetaldehyde hydrolase [Dehalococcoidia bacterium]
MGEQRLRGVILDWAGTLADYGSCAPAGVFVTLFLRRRVPITIAQAREPMGIHKRDHVAAVLRMPEVAALWEREYGRASNDGDVEAMYQELIPLQLDCLPRYAELIPGVLDAVRAFRARGLKIGTTTGYNREMLNVLLDAARAQGFEPDCAVSADEVPSGRPHPYMCFRCAIELEVYPLETCVKVGDTPPDIDEGRNAGMWTVAVAKTGNEMALTEQEVAALPAAELRERLDRAYARLRDAGAHYVVDGVADVPALLDEIEARLRRGEHP